MDVTDPGASTYNLSVGNSKLISIADQAQISARRPAMTTNEEM